MIETNRFSKERDFFEEAKVRGRIVGSRKHGSGSREPEWDGVSDQGRVLRSASSERLQFALGRWSG